MKIGISIPESLHSPERLFEWVKHVDTSPLSTLSVLDRVVHASYEPLILLTTAATLTTRVRLMTEVLISPLRNTTILAKQAATIDNLSKGRLTLGLGVGIRDDDFTATQSSYKGRGTYFDEQLRQMREVWSGHPLHPGIGLVGPQPVQTNGPEIILGGTSPQGYKRIGRAGNGFVTAINDIKEINRTFREVEKYWQEAGRPGKPRLMAQMDISLETRQIGRGNENVLAYYKGYSPFDEFKASTLIKTDQQIRQTIQELEQIGADEVVFFTWNDELSQIDRIASIIG